MDILTEGSCESKIESELAPTIELLCGLGWDVFPVNGKIPMRPWSRTLPSSELEPLLPDATGMAVALGPRSGGLVCRDFDETDAYHEWADELSELASVLPTARTPRGFHVYGRSEEPLCTHRFQDGELRGDGAYVVVPESAHPDGGSYRWIRKPNRFVPIVNPSDLLLPGQVLRGSESHKQSLLIHNCIRGIPGLPESLSGIPGTSAFVDQAIELTQPTGPGQRNRCLFTLAMLLRLRLDPDTPEADLLAIVERWFHLASSVIRTKRFDVSWKDFRAGWRYADPAKGFMTWLVDQYERGGYPVVTQDDDLDQVNGLFLAGEAYQGPGSTFFLSSRDVASIIGTSQMTANRRIRELRDGGLIIEIEKGRMKRKGANRASVWRIGDQARWIGPE